MPVRILSAWFESEIGYDFLKILNFYVDWLDRVLRRIGNIIYQPCNGENFYDLEFDLEP